MKNSELTKYEWVIIVLFIIGLVCVSFTVGRITAPTPDKHIICRHLLTPKTIDVPSQPTYKSEYGGTFPVVN